MNGYKMGQLVMATPKSFIDGMVKSPLKDTGLNYEFGVSDINVDGNVATVTLLESGFPGGVTITNYFHLIDDGSGWKIISKSFNAKS